MASRPDTPAADRTGTADPSAELASLVERTSGLQPGRRLFHAFNGSVVALALTWLDMARPTVLWILGGILAALVVLDVVRLTVPAANALFFRSFQHLASPREAAGPASSTWYTLGLLLTVALFPRDAAVTGVLFLAWADPAASYLGRRFGKRPFLGGSLEGTLVFTAVAAAVAVFRHGALVGAVAAVGGAFAERRSWPLDDNLTVPVVGAGLVTLLEALL
ncbi:MAG: hypothetical protein AMXMBFR53_28780 [Gemmatimonadota bacterium]